MRSNIRPHGALSKKIFNFASVVLLFKIHLIKTL